MTESTLKIKVDSTDVKTGTKSLDDLAKSGKDADKSTKELTSSSDILANSVKALAASYAVLKVVQYAREAAMLSARYETLGVSMRIVGNNAGYTSKEMEAAAKTMQATGISMLESRNQAVRLVQAHIDLSNASKLARIAQDAAVIGNINSSEAFAKLIHGIQTGQTEVLKTIGLNISMENSYKILAEELGVTVSSLDQTQKTTAILNAVFERGSDIAGTYEASMGTAGKQINSLARYQENLKLKLGETFDELLIVAVMGFTTSIKDANGAVDDLAAEDQLKEWGRSITDTFAFIADSGAGAAGVFKLVGTAIAANIGMTKALLTGDMEAFDAIANAYDADLQTIIDSTHTFRDALEETRSNMADSKAAEDLKQVNKDLEASIRSTADAMKSSWEEGMINAGVIEVISEKLRDYIADLENEQTALKMSTRDQAMYNAELDALAYGAGPKAVQTVRELAGENYDLAEATKAAERALNDAARASERAHRQMQQDFSRSMDRFGSSFADLVLEGDNAFDALAKSWERMLIEMAGQEIFKTLLGDSPTFNINGSSGSAVNTAASGATNSLISGAGSGIASAALAGLAFEAAQAGSLFSSAVSGITGVNSMVAPSTAAGGLGSGITGAIAAIPGWGWAIIAAGAAAAIFNNDDGKKRENAGFFVNDTPGAVGDSRAFDVDPFASGLAVTGFARRASQESAIEVIDTFRDLDFAFVEMVATLNGAIDLTNKGLNGLDEEATAGSQGTFLGLGGNGGLGGDIPAQINSYISQLVDNTTGLDASLLQAIQSASDADEVFALLADEIAKRAEADAIALPILKEKNKLQDELDALTMTRIELIAKERDTLDETNQAIFDSIVAIENLGIALEAQLTLDGALADAMSALRAVGDELRYLQENSLSAADDVERAQQRITDLNRQSADSMRAFAKTIDDFLVTLSPASYGQNLEGLKAQLTQTASLAAGGDLDAQSQLISQAQGVVRSAESSSATRADFFRQEAFVRTTLLGVRDAIGPDPLDPEAEPVKSPIEIAEEQLKSALAVQELADAAYEAGKALTLNLSFGDEDPLQPLMDTLEQLAVANTNYITALGELEEANSNAGIGVDNLTGMLGLTETEAMLLATSLGLTGQAALDFVAMMGEPLFVNTNAELLDNIASMFAGAGGMIGAEITALLSLVSAAVGIANASTAAAAAAAAAAASQAAAAAAAQAASVITISGGAAANDSGMGPIGNAGFDILRGIEVDNDYTESEIFSVIGGLNSGAFNVGQIGAHFGISTDEVSRLLAAGNQMQGFANGGMFGGGLRLVGENGPEIEATGPSRIYSNSQTKDMLKQDNSELVAELRALRIELSRLQGSTDVTASATARTNQLLEQITFGEMSLQTRAA